MQARDAPDVAPLLEWVNIRMFRKRSPTTDRDLDKLIDEQLSLLPLSELQRIRSKRWAHGIKERRQRAEDELSRRDPRKTSSCARCANDHYRENEIRVAGSFGESFLGWERNKLHAIVCNYCGKTEFYSVLMSGSEQGIGLFGS